ILSAAGEHLRMVGRKSGPFHEGAVLIDERDWTAEHVEAIRANDARRTRMDAEAEPLRKLLRQHGNLWALRPGDREGASYLLNYTPRGERNVFGWYTLEEIARRQREGDWTV